MNCTTESIAALCGLAYLETATRLLDRGDYASARALVDEGIKQTENAPNLDVSGKLRDLQAVIGLQERIGKSEALSILGRHYFIGTDAEVETHETPVPPDPIQH